MELHGSVFLSVRMEPNTEVEMNKRLRITAGIYGGNLHDITVIGTDLPKGPSGPLEVPEPTVVNQ